MRFKYHLLIIQIPHIIIKKKKKRNMPCLITFNSPLPPCVAENLKPTLLKTDIIIKTGRKTILYVPRDIFASLT